MRWAAAGAAWLLVEWSALGAPTPSHSPLRATWTAPEGCPDEASVVAAIEAMVGAAYVQEHGSDLVAEAVVRGGPVRFSLDARIERSRVSEAKTMEAESCQTLADAYAVIVAFALDPASGVSLPVPVPPPSALPLASSRKQVAPPAPAETKSASERVRVAHPFRLPAFEVGPFGAVGLGMLPFPSLGVGARVSVEAGLRWELAGTYWPERFASASVGSTSAVGAYVELATVGPSVCKSFERDAVAVCIGADIGAMSGKGADVPNFSSGTSWWVAPTSAVSVRLSLTRMASLRFRLDVGVPIYRPSFVVDNIGGIDGVKAYQPAPAFGAISLEPEFLLFSTDSFGAGHDEK